MEPGGVPRLIAAARGREQRKTPVTPPEQGEGGRRGRYTPATPVEPGPSAAEIPRADTYLMKKTRPSLQTP